MKTSTRVGALIISIATGIGALVPLGTAASAAPKPHVKCAKVNAPPLKGETVTSTFAKCTPGKLKAGGTSVVKPGTGETSGKLVMTIKWKNKRGKTKATVKYTAAKKKRKCKGNTTRIVIKGRVIKSTGAAAKIIKKGEPVKGSVCAITAEGPKQGKTVIEPGTKFTL